MKVLISIRTGRCPGSNKNAAERYIIKELSMLQYQTILVDTQQTWENELNKKFGVIIRIFNFS